MPQPHSFRAIPGSERHPLPNAHSVASVDSGKPIKLTIYVRPKATNIEVPALAEIGQNPHQFWNAAGKEKALEAFTADLKDIRAVQKFAASNKLKVLEASPVKRSVLVEGKTGDAAQAFGVDLKIWEHPGGRYRGRTGPVFVPAALDGIVEAVFGFDNRPIGRPFFRRAQRRLVARAQPANTYLPPQLGKLYSFPTGTTGNGETVAILSFNGAIGDTGETALGGYDPQMVKTYFTKVLKMTPPSITNVIVHGPGNQPGDGSQQTDATGEVLLDVCTAGALAPKAKFFMYFTEFTEQGWVDCLTSVVTATPNPPSVISISYGNPEDGPAGDILWTKQAIMKVSEAFKRAALANMTVCCASGDQGSTEELPDHRQHVDFPASSPWVLGCGGTRVIAHGDVITSETVWNDGPDSATGGGVSTLFAVPSYQSGAGVPPSVNPGHRLGRGVPDVSSLADPQTGVIVAFPDGTVQPLGGTSAAAPLWAALIACLNEGVGKPVGFLNPVLYKSLSSGVLRDITQGDNGAYSAKSGWDPCTGFGSPNGERLLTALKSLSV
jgi:kumamolisin